VHVTVGAADTYELSQVDELTSKIEEVSRAITKAQVQITTIEKNIVKSNKVRFFWFLLFPFLVSRVSHEYLSV
jgi:hypothetical protein